MRDTDDDVRSVAASTLLPITDTLAAALPQAELAALLNTLWDCLTEDTDELGSSTAAIMDLLGELSVYTPLHRLMTQVK
jgi:TATA-binding protein-associated factor